MRWLIYAGFGNLLKDTAFKKLFNQTEVIKQDVGRSHNLTFRSIFGLS